MSTRPNNEKIRILERSFNATPSLDRCYSLFRFWSYKKLVPFHNKQPIAEPDAQADFDIEEKEEVQVQVQGAVQSDARYGYFESVDHVQPVKPEPDAKQRYLEGSGP